MIHLQGAHCGSRYVGIHRFVVIYMYIHTYVCTRHLLPSECETQYRRVGYFRKGEIFAILFVVRP